MAKDPKTKTVAKPEFKEVTALGGKIAYSGVFTDNSMEATPQNIRTWRGFTRDHQVSSTWQQRRLAVMSVDWDVVAGGEEQVDQLAAEALKDDLAKAGFNHAFGRMMWGKFYGFSVAEVMWTRTASRIGIDAILVRAVERFRFDRLSNELLFTGGAHPSGEPLADRKMWVYRVPGDSDDVPHGPPIGWQLYWPMFLKENGAAFWAVAIEKYGMPTATGKHPQGLGQPEIDNFVQALLAVHGNAAVAFPDGFEVELLEAMRTSGGDYSAFQEYWDKAVSKIIVGQTMTTDDGSSKSQATVHRGILDMVIQADADEICDSFNDGPGKWWSEWNFPSAHPPKVVRRIKKAEDLTKLAERDKTLSEATGRHLSPEYVAEKYNGVEFGDPRPSPGQQAPAAPPAPGGASFAAAFAEPDNISELADQVDDLTAPMVTAMFADIEQILSTSRDLPEFQARLLRYAAEHENKELANMIAGGAAVAALTGMDEA